MTALLNVSANDPRIRGDNEYREAVCAWLKSVGVDPAAVTAAQVIETSNRYRLHLTEKVRDEGGSDVFDHRTNSVATKQRVLELGDVANWPGADDA